MVCRLQIELKYRVGKVYWKYEAFPLFHKFFPQNEESRKVAMVTRYVLDAFGVRRFHQHF